MRIAYMNFDWIDEYLVTLNFLKSQLNILANS